MAVWLQRIVGESFSNPDGSSRQEELKRCEVGEEITFDYQPETEFGETIFIISERNICIGVIPRDDVASLLSANFCLT